VREAAERCEQALDKVRVGLSLDKGLYEAIAAIDLGPLAPDTQQWLTRSLLEFRRAGVDRDEATRAKIRALNEELTQVGQTFGKNVIEGAREVKLAPEALAGLPKDYVDAHPPGPDGKVTVTTNYPDYFPFMAYAQSDVAREALWREYRLRAYPANLAVLMRLLELRHQLATLLGYPDWAAYATEDKMVKSTQAAQDFIWRVSQLAYARAQSDMKALLDHKRKTQPKATEVHPWEHDRLLDQVRKAAFGFDSQQVRPYFEYERVKAGVLDVTSRLFGITYRKAEGATTWHPDVDVYDVLEKDRLLGRIYLDMHPREGKYKHAAQFELTVGQKGAALPEGVLVCNFPKTEGGRPGLMQHSEVETLFHEFGHLLHHIFGGHQRWSALSGVRTEWDFVEVPSMLLQEWATHPATLQTFARHHETNAPIPTALVEKLKAASEFGKGVYTRRQMFLAMVSLEYHALEPGFDTTKMLEKIQKGFLPFRREWVPGTFFHLSFGHLEGYSALYYTYLWSTVIAKDLLTAFQGDKMLDPVTAGRLRERILSAGGSKDAAVLVQDFLGRPYEFAAFQTWLNGP
jgi:thimet oligopeptidase